MKVFPLIGGSLSYLIVLKPFLPKSLGMCLRQGDLDNFTQGEIDANEPPK